MWGNRDIEGGKREADFGGGLGRLAGNLWVSRIWVLLFSEVTKVWGSEDVRKAKAREM